MFTSIKATKYFGGLAAVKNVDFTLEEGEIVGLIGPNGAGKTTIFNLITGIYRATSGKIEFKGVEINKLSPHKICHLGIGRTFQITRPFPNLTTLANVMLSTLFGKRKSMSMKDARREALHFLEFVGLREERDTLAKNLTLYKRKMLELARALATKPTLILLDEVAAGLNPTETLRAIELINKIRSELGVTVFWIEHIMKAVMEASDRVIVLHHGEKIAEGTPKEIARNQKVIEAYLGEAYA